MILPFKPLSLCFNQINYYVDMPKEMKQQGVVADQLRLLHDVSGAFRPGILTALVGVSGAGKTTSMDVSKNSGLQRRKENDQQRLLKFMMDHQPHVLKLCFELSMQRDFMIVQKYFTREKENTSFRENPGS